MFVSFVWFVVSLRGCAALEAAAELGAGSATLALTTAPRLPFMPHRRRRVRHG